MTRVEEYLRKMNATPEERNELLAWIRNGNDFTTNGDYITDESGRPMDYISASRFMEDICAQYAVMGSDERAKDLYGE